MSIVFAGAIASSACDNNNGVGIITTAPAVAAVATISPGLVDLTALGGFNCPGVAFTTSFDIIIVSGSSAQSMDSASFRLLDGTTVGGPSVTVPSMQLNTLFGSTLVLPGTSRSFGMHPAFGCTVGKPHAIDATVVLVDGHGRQQSIKSTIGVR